MGLGFSLSFGSSFLGGVFTTGFWPTAGLVGLDIEVVDGAGVELVVEPEVAVVFVGAGGVGLAVGVLATGFGTDAVVAEGAGFVVEPAVAVVFAGAGGVDLTTIFGVTTGAPAGEAGGDGLARLPLPEFTEPLPELIDEPPALGLGRELTLIGFSRMVPLDPL